MKSFITPVFILTFLVSFSQKAVQPFMPEIIKQFPNVRDIAISPNGNEVMFTAQSVMGNLSAIIHIKKENDTWLKPEVASFSGQHFDLEPFFSHDGLTLFFVSTRPLDSSSTEPKDFDIWYVKRTDLDANWSEPTNMGAPINTEHGEFYPSISNNGNFYFTRDNPTLKRKDDIYISELKNGNYTEPVVLPDTVNSDGYEYNAFIAPDESYLLFGGYNRKDGLGSGDLYISYHTENGWTQAENLGNLVNCDKMDYCPFVDFKTNTLYFTSKHDNTNTNLPLSLSITDLLLEFDKYDNGASRLYKVFIDELLKK
ncbi:hypothetical protein L3X39_06180 [Sabulilitoribacter multivorans]|uniref:WD40-like Beta Propeller Repeat n=1 Tax=Flaviramulus multivorans TaxID=1304750 RepID=A0ABS9IHI3_9FLAO|nr:hypothetical protein [Flaviramulus multivorans]MCF7560221.1 hypothetical protein [Flaviramulus multivorans]